MGGGGWKYVHENENVFCENVFSDRSDNKVLAKSDSGFSEKAISPPSSGVLKSAGSDQEDPSFEEPPTYPEEGAEEVEDTVPIKKPEMSSKQAHVLFEKRVASHR